MGALFIDDFVLAICALLAQMENSKLRKNGEIAFPAPAIVLAVWIVSMPLALWLAAGRVVHDPPHWSTIAIGSSVTSGIVAS